MKVQIIQTTDCRHVGVIHEVPAVTVEVCKALGMRPTSIIWAGDICTIQNTNYTVKLKKLES